MLQGGTRANANINSRLQVKRNKDLSTPPSPTVGTADGSVADLKKTIKNKDKAIELLIADVRFYEQTFQKLETLLPGLQDVLKVCTTNKSRSVAIQTLIDAQIDKVNNLQEYHNENESKKTETTNSKIGKIL